MNYPDGSVRRKRPRRAPMRSALQVVFLLQSTFVPVLAQSQTTSIPTTRPTGPRLLVNLTETPSHMPTMAPSTSLPTGSLQPSVMPSENPSSTPSRSPRPTASPQPSWVPSLEPSGIPTIAPTSSVAPTESHMPSVSFLPSLSLAPSETPSRIPTAEPSESPSTSVSPSEIPSQSPSISPTVSFFPSTSPSISLNPSLSAVPSVTPTNYPTTMPSIAPSSFPSTIRPTMTPSLRPTSNPSAQPTVTASMVPTAMPTLMTESFTQSSIIMTMEGFGPGLLSDEEIMEWENITSKFVFDFYREAYDVNEDHIFPWNVTFVETTFKRQAIVPSPRNSEWLEIEYSQTIVVGLLDERSNLPDFSVMLFSIPFDYQSYEYLLEFFLLWELETFPLLISLVIEEPPPSPAPSLQKEDPGGDDKKGLTPRATRALSTCIVLSAVLIVVFLFYDRHRKEQILIQSLSRRGRDGDGIEFDNAGHVDDWRNPYNDDTGISAADVPSSPPPSQQQQPQDAATPVSGSAAAAAAATSIPPPSPRSHARSSSENQIPTPPRAHIRSLTGNSLPPLPPRTNSGSLLGRSANSSSIPEPMQHDRHVSVTDTIITDITYSEGHSEEDSEDIGPPILPTISSEDGYSSQEQNAGPRSPLHIPDDDEGAVDLSGISPPPSPERRRQEVLGLDGSYTLPSMTGFDLQIQDLE